MSPRSSSHFGLAPPTLGHTRFGSIFVLSVAERVHLDLSLFPRSIIRPGSLVFAYDLAHTELGPSSQGYSYPGSPMPVIAASYLASLLLVLDFVHSEFVASPRTSARLGSALLVLNFASSGLSTSLHGCACPGSTLLAVGLACAGFCFLPLVIETMTLDLSTFARSFGRLELVLLVLDFLHLESRTSVRSLVRVDFSMFLAGMPRAGSIFSLLVVDTCEIEFMPSARSLAKPELLIPVLEKSYLGFFPSLRQFAQLSLTALILGSARFESVLLVLDAVTSDFSALLQGCAYLESSTSAMLIGHLGLMMFLRGLGRTNSSMFLVGLACLGFIFSFFLVDFAHMDLLLLLRSMAHLELFASTLGDAMLASTLSPQSFSRSNSSMLILNFASLDFFPFARNSARAAFCTSVRAFALPGGPSSVLDVASFAPSAFLRSFACSARCTSVLDASHMAFSLSLQQPCRMEPFLSVLGLSRLDSVFFPSAVEAGLLGSSLLLHSISRLGLVLLVLDFATLGPFLPSQGVARSGFCSSAYGYVKFNYAESMSVVNSVNMGFQMPLRSYARFGSFLSVVHCTHLDLLLSSQGIVRLDLLLLAFGLACLGFQTFALDAAQLESVLFLRSIAQSGLAASALTASRPGFFLPLRGPSWLDSFLPTVGLTCAGLVFPLPVVDHAFLDSSPSTRSMTRTGFAVPVFDLLHLGFPLSPRSFA